MPIIRPPLLRCLSQDEFRELAFTVKGIVIDIHREFGRFFDERVYKLELARRVPGVRLEEPVDVTHLGFAKRYFLDAVVADGGLFEFKAAETFSPRHRAQLIHYLMLCDLEHAMLLATRADRVVSEFVNTFYPLTKRLQYRIDASHWDTMSAGATKLEEITRALLADWGAGLDVSLYEEALTHFLGGELSVVRPVQVTTAGVPLTEQKVRLNAERVAFKVTAFAELPSSFESHAQPFIQHTDLTAIQWININPECVSFTTITA
ncbi:MAG: GxxExxY protein [Opitutus sp.]|nr:GxxExxY protein [Opitutus sp.]